MPRRDGTGPMGEGPLTGRGFGTCTGTNALVKCAGLGLGLGLGMACRRGFGRGFRRFSSNPITPESRKSILQSQKEALNHQLAAIDKELKDL